MFSYKPRDVDISETRGKISDTPTKVEEIQTTNNEDPYSLFSEEIFLHIFRFLDPKSLCTCSLVSKSWYHISSDDQLWKEKVASVPPRGTKRLYGDQIQAERCQWKKLYFDLGKIDYSQNHLFSFSLLELGLEASSFDHKNQNIRETLNTSDTSFWSSKGSDNPESNEHLIYQLKQPICMIFSVSVLPYQAMFQQGQPIYAPKAIQISVGFRSNHMHWKSPVYHIENAHKTFTFDIAPHLVIGAYIRIDLLGRYQTQPQDDLYYTVVEHVSASGLPIGTITNIDIANSMIDYALQYHRSVFLEEFSDEISEGYYKEICAAAKVLKKREEEKKKI